MPHERYIVVRHEHEWLIKFGDGEYAPTAVRPRRCSSQ
jgi:hypothetical protein